LYPARTCARLRFPSAALAELENAARDLGKEFNFPAALWGNADYGYLHVWILQPDDQARTVREAGELLKKILEVAIVMGGSLVPGAALPFTMSQSGSSKPEMTSLRAKLLERCDPNGLHVALKRD
jgi:hypothetical protein